jgi:hypothetical protein
MLVISIFASLFSPAENKRGFLVAFAFETGNTGIINTDVTATIGPKTCFQASLKP